MSNIKKVLYPVLAALLASVLFSACGPHTHKWKDATCLEPQTCKECGKTQGEKSSEHSWIEATCTEPKTCEVCGLTEGKPLNHKSGEWETEVEATLSRDGVKVKRCVRCGEELDSEEVVKYIDVEDGNFNFTADELIDYLELGTRPKITKGESYDESRQTLINYIATEDKEIPYEVNVVTEGRTASDPLNAVLIDISAEKKSYPKEILEKLTEKLELSAGKRREQFPDVEELADFEEPYRYFENKQFRIETKVNEHFLICISRADSSLKETAEFVDSILHIPFYLDITFNKNIIFDKYGVEVWVNEDQVAALDHGEDFTKLLTVPRGDYTLKFISQKDSKVTVEESVHVNGPTTIRCTIQTHSGDIEFKEYEVLSNVDSAVIVMPNLIGMTLDKAEEALEALGFIDIRNDVGAWFYSKSDYQVISQRPEPGTTNEYNTAILLSCLSVENAQNTENTRPVTTPGPTPTPTPSPEEETAESEYERAYVRELSGYSIYYMFDEDTRTALYFYTDDTSVSEGTYAGDFSDTIEVRWNDGGGNEKLVMGENGTVTLIDANGFEWDYKECSVGKAELALREIKR